MIGHRALVLGTVLRTSLGTVLLASLAAGTSALAAQDEDVIELAPFESSLLQLQAVAPADWTDAGGGVYTRSGSGTDVALVVMQAAPLPVEQLWPALLPQLGLTEIPEPTESRTTDHLEWDLYRIDVAAPPVSVRMGLAEAEGKTYIVIVQSRPDEFEGLVEAVFDPVVASLQPFAPQATPDLGKLGYGVEDVTFPGGDAEVTLGGTLTLPAGPGPHPAIVLLNGSGAQDRDSSFRPITELAPFADIADALTRSGVAVLRYDDRGVGGSTGNYVTATIANLTGDARAALDFLAGRADIDAERMGTLGHSEGAVYAARLGADDPRVSFVVSMAGPAVDGFSTILAQQEAVLRSMGTSEDDIGQAVAYNEAAIRHALDGDLEAAEATLREAIAAVWDRLSAEEREVVGDRDAWVDRNVQAQLPRLQSEYVRSFLEADPGADWARVTVPVLGLFGARDVQVVREQNEPALRAALESAGNEDYEIVVFPDANHLFQSAETGALEEYATLAPELTADFLPTLVDWVTTHAGVAG